MKRILYWILAWTLMSCADDLGNYDYRELPDVKIEGISSSITVLAYQNLSIPVTLKGTLAPESRYEYEWRAIKLFKPEAGDELVDTLAVTKDLDRVISLSPGAYKLIYTVKDKENNVFYQQTADMSVVTTTSEGWLVLCSENGNVRLDMVSNVLDEEIHSKNMLAESGMPYKRGPRALIYLKADENQVDEISPFYLLTDDGATRLHRNAFEWKEEYGMKYEMGDQSEPKTWSIVCAGYFRAMINGTDMQYSDYGGPKGLWGSPLNYVRDSENNNKQRVKVAPVIGCNIVNSMLFGPMFMLYDMDGKQFVQHSGGMYSAMVGGGILTECLPMTDEEIGGDAFRFPVGYDYVYMENTKYNPDYSAMYGMTYTVLDDGTKYHLYGIRLGDALAALMPDVLPPTLKSYYADLSGCTDIRQASHFAFHSLTNQMFYSVGGKIYRVDLQSARPTADFQFDIGETITCLKFYLCTKAENKMRTYDLIVGTDNGGVDGGVLRIYDASNYMSSLPVVAKESYTGFAKIVDVIYREK